MSIVIHRLKIILLILTGVFFLNACATYKKVEIQSLSPKEKKISVKNKDEAKAVVKNKMDYMKLFFQQSFDPYFGDEKIHKECEQRLFFSEQQEDSEGVWAFANVPINKNWQVGCGTSNKLSLYILRYCKAQQIIYEYWLEDQNSKNITPKGIKCGGKLLL